MYLDQKIDIGKKIVNRYIITKLYRCLVLFQLHISVNTSIFQFFYTFTVRFFFVLIKINSLYFT